MENENVRQKIESYPKEARAYAHKIRSLIYETAQQEGVCILEESLKWGEPSFKAVNGSPIRMDWKSKTPNKFFVFFNCKTNLVDTYRGVYGSELQFEGTRAIVLDLSEEIPRQILEHCFSIALKYHKIKKLPQKKLIIKRLPHT
jgi:hypothetical protein